MTQDSSDPRFVVGNVAFGLHDPEAAMRNRVPRSEWGQYLNPKAPYQDRVQPWLEACFGRQIAIDKVERNHRFLEESLELVQALGCTRSEAHQLVDYVFSREKGDPDQETGGVMNTLAALALANGLNMHEAGERELARVSQPHIMEKIRAKQAAKPKHSPLPESEAAPPVRSQEDGE